MVWAELAERDHALFKKRYTKTVQSFKKTTSVIKVGH